LQVLDGALPLVAENIDLLYMSWNGAKEHQTWTVFGGIVNGSLSEVANVKKIGFERMVVVPQLVEFAKVEANGKGIQTGVSDIVDVLEGC
jgi:uncharacterized radical SAM superfamily Fe-S cluster-containing enzyme